MTARRLLPLAIGVLACLLGMAAAPAGAHSATYAQTVAGTPGLSAYWRLGEGPGTTSAADAANAWPGTYVAPKLGAQGALSDDSDAPVRFPGSGYVNAGQGPAFA